MWLEQSKEKQMLNVYDLWGVKKLSGKASPGDSPDETLKLIGDWEGMSSSVVDESALDGSEDIGLECDDSMEEEECEEEDLKIWMEL